MIYFLELLCQTEVKAQADEIFMIEELRLPASPCRCFTLENKFFGKREDK